MDVVSMDFLKTLTLTASLSRKITRAVFVSRYAGRVRTRVFLFVFLLTLTSLSQIVHAADFIDWKNLHNPVLSYPNWSVKDAAMAYRNGVFYVFFSAFYEDRGQVRSHVVEVSTRDFKTYSQPIFNFDGEEDGWLGMCSPDVQRIGDHYVMTFNSWGDKPGKWNALFYKTSNDLSHWSKTMPLAAELTAGKRDRKSTRLNSSHVEISYAVFCLKKKKKNKRKQHRFKKRALPAVNNHTVPAPRVFRAVDIHVQVQAITLVQLPHVRNRHQC